MTPQQRKKWADISTIISAIITAFGVIVSASAIVIGVRQFQETQESEHESRAVELSINYNELMKEQAASTKAFGTPENLWRENLAINIAEAIFRLKRGDRGWENTVRGIIETHKEFAISEHLNCDTFDPDFIELVNQKLQQNVCSEKQSR